MHRQAVIDELEEVVGYGDVIEGTPNGVVVMVSNLFVAKVTYEELPSQTIDDVTIVRTHNISQEFVLLSEIERVSVASAIGDPRIKLHLKSGEAVFFDVAKADFVQGALQPIMLHMMNTMTR